MRANLSREFIGATNNPAQLFQTNERTIDGPKQHTPVPPKSLVELNGWRIDAQPAGELAELL